VVDAGVETGRRLSRRAGFELAGGGPVGEVNDERADLAPDVQHRGAVRPGPVVVVLGRHHVAAGTS
jgi:hypothetical protein